jgi:hypothetical protein
MRKKLISCDFVSENSAPVFNVEEVAFNLTLGSLFEHTLSATDANGDTLTIRAEGHPAGATITRNGNDLTFSWLPDHTNTVGNVFNGREISSC